MSSHSVIGASSCERFWNCPGSVILGESIPDAPSSIYAVEGTVAHGIAERYLRKGSRIDDALLGDVITQEGFGIEVTEGMLEAVAIYLDEIYSGLSLLKGKGLMVEAGFTLPHLDPDARGTCDAAIPLRDWPRIYDYKHGAGQPVEVKGNKQTLYYGLGYYRDLTWEKMADVEGLATTIVQPRCAHPDGPVRTAYYTVDELLEFESGLDDAIRRVRNGDDTLKAGPWCKWCKAKPFCSEARDFTARTAYQDFIDVEFDDEDVETDRQSLAVITGTESRLLKVNRLSTDELAAILDRIQFLKEWCNSIESYAYHLADKGFEIPNYMLVDRRSQRKWKDEKRVIDDLEIVLGEKLYNPRKLRSPAQMERALPKALRSLIDSYTEKPDKGKTLVRVDKGRKKRLPSVVTDFMHLDF